MKIINLLPKSRQQLLRDESVFRSLFGVIGLSLLSFGVVVGAQLGVKIYLETQASSIRQQVRQITSQVSKSENAAIKTKITRINNLIADYRTLSNSAPKWSKVIQAFAPLPPPGVVIGSFNINFANKSVTINGLADNRQAVIQLYNNILKADQNFYNIDYPLENVARAENIPFHFTFFIRDGLLK